MGTLMTGASSASQSFVFTNKGPGQFVVTGITGPGGPFSMSSNCLDNALDVEGMCYITVVFSPHAAGSFIEYITVQSNMALEPSLELTLLGMGLPHNFTITGTGGGTVFTGPGTQTITITNNGTIPYDFGTLGTLPQPFSVTQSTCTNATLGPGQSCTVQVSFDPTEAGTWGADLHIDIEGTADDLGIHIVGSYNGLPTIMIEDSSPIATDQRVQCGRLVVGATSLHTITVNNVGTGALEVLSVLPPDAPYSLESDDCSGRRLSPLTSCTLAVKFAPHAVGDYSGSVLIRSNDPTRPEVAVTLTGMAVPVVTNYPPGAASLSQPAPGAGNVQNPVLFTWGHSSDPDGDALRYKLYYSQSGQFNDYDPVDLQKPGGVAFNVSMGGFGLSVMLLGMAGIVRGRRTVLMALCLCVAVASMTLYACGGGSAAPPSGSTKVTISTAQTGNKAAGVSAQAIPFGISTMVFKVTAPDMEPIVRNIVVTPGQEITESFVVPNGLDRHFELYALGAQQNVIYMGDAYKNLNGTQTSVQIFMSMLSELSYLVNLQPGTTYYWKVEVSDGAESAQTEVRTFTTAP